MDARVCAGLFLGTFFGVSQALNRELYAHRAATGALRGFVLGGAITETRAN